MSWMLPFPLGHCFVANGVPYCLPVSICWHLAQPLTPSTGGPLLNMSSHWWNSLCQLFSRWKVSGIHASRNNSQAISEEYWKINTLASSVLEWSKLWSKITYMGSQSFPEGLCFKHFAQHFSDYNLVTPFS